MPISIVDGGRGLLLQMWRYVAKGMKVTGRYSATNGVYNHQKPRYIEPPFGGNRWSTVKGGVDNCGVRHEVAYVAVETQKLRRRVHEELTWGSAP
jgi:hypothetical protein